MKVIHFSTERFWRGGEQQIAYLIHELNKVSIENHLICRKHSKMHKYAENNGIAHTAINIKNAIDPFAILKTADIFRKLKADFIHLHTSKAHSIALFSTLFCGTQRFILHRRVSFKISESTINKWKYNHPAIKKIICISEDVKKQVAKLVSSASKMEVIYSGIDLNKFNIAPNPTALREEFQIPDDYLIVTGIGALSPEKDFKTFMKSARNAAEAFEKVHFLIVGDGKEKEALIAFSDSLGMKDKITFTGFREDIPAILLSSDIFMLCSVSEGLGTSFIDAAAAACPLIGTDAGGISEIISDNENGFLATVGNHNAIGKHLLNLLEDEGLRNRMAEAAKTSSLKFSITTMGQKYIEVYKTLQVNA